MGKVLLVYASMSGNTEAMADLIEKGLLEGGAEVDRHEAMDVDAALFNDYQHMIFGAYTWGDGELPDEFLDIYDDMEGMDFTGKTFAVFGSEILLTSIFAVPSTFLKIKSRSSAGTWCFRPSKSK